MLVFCSERRDAKRYSCGCEYLDGEDLEVPVTGTEECEGEVRLDSDQTEEIDAVEQLQRFPKKRSEPLSDSLDESTRVLVAKVTLAATRAVEALQLE